MMMPEMPDTREADWMLRELMSRAPEPPQTDSGGSGAAHCLDGHRFPEGMEYCYRCGEERPEAEDLGFIKITGLPDPMPAEHALTFGDFVDPNIPHVAKTWRNRMPL